MRVKLFQAATIAEAMAQIRAELGADAIILEQHRTRHGIEVTAALEPDEPLLIQPLTTAAPLAAPGPLDFHNIPQELLQLLARTPLQQSLAEALSFAPLPSGRERPLLLCGPPGVGKTLTVAKLTARLVLAGAPPLVITTDGQRAGAVEQLAAFTRVLGVTLAVAPTPAMLAKALTHRNPGQPVLIDTAGCNPFNADQARQLHQLVIQAGADMALVLPAGLDAAEAGDLARAFAALGARHLLPTRLDAARRLGSVLMAAKAGPLSLTEAGIGPEVADGLETLTPEGLASRLLSSAQNGAAQGGAPGFGKETA
ncbi:MAG: GTPase [Roseomonas sp.]|jgi:flagellar biosynthesis protein FlhF|nr:GTPase [Roseomonas sp.]